VPARTTNRDLLGVHHETGTRGERVADAPEEEFRNLDDRAAAGAHEMPMTTVGPVVDGCFAAELERGQDRELHEEIQRSVHGRAIGA
jgi:maleate cis-trans isomerase